MALRVPEALLALAARSAVPDKVSLAFERLAVSLPDRLESMLEAGQPNDHALAFVVVVAASDSLGRLCVTEARAHDVLIDLDRKIEPDASDRHSVALHHRLQILRTAARDLLGRDSFEEVTWALSESAAWALEKAVDLAGGGQDVDLAVVGMGKLGGGELNYASDVDVIFVTEGVPDDDLARQVVSVARHAFRVDTDLRPEGRSGPLARSLESFRAYWGRWAQAWEFQALIKARAVAGRMRLGERFCGEARDQVWDRTYSSDEIALIRRLKERSEAVVARHGLADRELKRGPGGIRDVEFAVQLLQLVHGRRDPSIRSRSTLVGLLELASSGYLGTEDAESLARAYVFLRTVEHRLQLVEEQQTHTIPKDAASKERLARVLGFEDGPARTATSGFDDALRECRNEVRSLHERLFFRPLLEAFAALPVGRGTERADVATTGVTGGWMSPERIAERLGAFGFAGAKRTKAAVDELVGGLTRSSRLMEQMLPLLLDWLSVTPDPDLGLLGLRNLALHPHHRSRLVTTFRESPEAARRLCLLLGSSRTLGEAVARNPELMGRLGDDDALAMSRPDELRRELSDRLHFTDGDSDRSARLLRFRQEQLVQIAARDLLEMDDDPVTEHNLSSVAEVVLEVAIDEIGPPIPFCVVGLGRFGGGELSYASDLDVVFVTGIGEERSESPVPGDVVAEQLLRLLHGTSPAERIFSLDLGLRPEGGQGRLSRDVDGYDLYFQRWAQTWERQALLRARVVAGDRSLGARFNQVVHRFVWEPPIGGDEIAEIRRMKARVERERIPAGEDPEFHLKLGKGSLSDVEWTVQLLQLRNRVEGSGTMEALDKLQSGGFISDDDAGMLRDSYRFCERTRNRWHLVGALPGGAPPGDSLPSQSHQLSRLARSLGTTPVALREDYKRVTRRARAVMERLFYGIDTARTFSGGG
jgi:[glutamine synthetase] adenylyltransferase / [glutamine synthetase]-adenylyl-L-tyrosine phosphorylase